MSPGLAMIALCKPLQQLLNDGLSQLPDQKEVRETAEELTEIISNWALEKDIKGPLMCFTIAMIGVSSLDETLTRVMEVHDAEETLRNMEKEDIH